MGLARLLLGMMLAFPAPALTQKAAPNPPVGIVPVRPASLKAPADPWRPVGKPRPGMCIDAGRIGGAEVLDPRTVDLVMKGGTRWRLMLQQDCPQITFYGGFYYSQSRAGMICAGQDRVIGRAGGNCQVRAVVQLRRAPRR